MKQYGDYVTFEHEPTENEVEEAIEYLLYRFKNVFKEKAAIVKEIDDDGRWAVGIKFLLNK